MNETLLYRPVRVLDSALANQIAAGEVVERPASAVKELVENALDAKARSVRIDVDDGGIGLIRVTDDGYGMLPEDALLAVERHATSKIAAPGDLNGIQSFGFRGEALPSIGSVSRMIVRTRSRDAISGTEVVVEGGAKPVVTEVGCAPGTCIEVRDLFYNVPARRKFLRSQTTESAHVTDVVVNAALSQPRVRFSLTRDGKRVREFLPVDTFADRAIAVFEGHVLAPLSGERDGLSVEAFLSAPEQSRSGAGGLHVFVNQRPVHDRSLTRAVAFAYGSVLPRGRYPVGAVYLSLDPRQVDVNVHPQKAEVRFARGRVIVDALTRVLAAKLGTSAWSGPAARGSGYWQERLAPPPPNESFPAKNETDPWALSSSESVAPLSFSFVSGVQEQAAEYGLERIVERMAAAQPTTESLQNVDTGFFGSLRVLGQVRKMLIVCEGEDGLHVLDQHAADERVNFHRLRQSFDKVGITTQALLFPVHIECSAEDVAVVEERSEDLLRAGFECSILGPTTVAIRSAPALLYRANPERLLRDLLGELTQTGHRSFGDTMDKALATMACHGSIRAGDVLSKEEIGALLRGLDDVDSFPGHCPHGRPIVFSIAYSDLERRLGR